jgi:hypothetical protein
VARRLLIAAIVAICLAGPIAEMFDRWDQTSKDGNDTEANIVVVALCAGIAFATGTVVVISRIRALSSTLVPVVTASPRLSQPLQPILPVPTSSPPAVLRV